MSNPNKAPRDGSDGALSASARSNIAMLVFGFFTLCFLVAIDHEEWFHLRPISAGAVAVSHASDQASETP